MKKLTLIGLPFLLGAGIGLLVGALVLTSDDDGSDSSNDTTIAADGPDGGSLPKPLKNAPVDSAEAAVERLVRWARAGSASNVTTLYDPKVIDTFGSATIGGALQTQLSGYATPGIKIAEVEPTDLGVLITLQRPAKEGQPPVNSSFLLNKRKGRWVIRYDSALNAGLVTYVQRQTQAKSGSKSDQITPEAQAAGLEAGARYLSLFAPEPVRTRLSP